jgi:MobA/MobL family protein
MAIYRLQIEPVKRSDGHSSVAAAAYRAGERIRDDRTNEIHNHSRRKDVTHSEIMLPSELSGSENMEWARNRSSLWNTVENAEPRKNARVAREIQVNLPHELSAERRVALARSFSQEVADHYKVAVDLAVHEPRPSGDPRNHHAHLLMTTREVSAQGLGAKAGLELSTHERIRLGLPSGAQEYTAIRERWAAVTNEALKEANIEARVDHRSLADQGVDREPKPHIPFAAYKIERAGQHSDVAESIRADYTARVQARLERQATHESNAATPQHTNAATSMSADGPAPQRNVAPSVAADGSTSQRTVPTSVAAAGPTSQPALTPAPPPKSLEEVRREARENWLKLRAASTQQPDQPTPIPDHSTHNQPTARHPAAAASPTPTRVPDNDQTL